MFIASYATFIPTVSAVKTNNSLKESSASKTAPFTLPQETPKPEQKQEAEFLSTAVQYSLRWQQEKNKNLQKFEKIKTVHDAQTAYKESTTPFSTMKKPKAVLHNSLQSSNLSKEKAVNAYIENNHYYQVTAA